MTKPLTIEQQLIKKAYRHWMKGQSDNWYKVSPYICDCIRWAEDEVKGTLTSISLTSYDMKINFIQNKCLKGEDSVQEFMKLCTYKNSHPFGRDPLAIAFRHGLWLRIAEEYNVKL